jgi:hypothetical protein
MRKEVEAEEFGTVKPVFGFGHCVLRSWRLNFH